MQKHPGNRHPPVFARCTGALVLAASLVSSWRATAQSLDPAAQPTGDRVERVLPNRPLLWVSAPVLGGAYAASVIVAATSDNDADHRLYVPVIGPWLALAAHECSGPQAVSCDTGTGRGVGLFFDGLAQTAGAVGTVLSFVVPQLKPVRVGKRTTLAIWPTIVGTSGGELVLTLTQE